MPGILLIINISILYYYNISNIFIKIIITDHYSHGADILLEEIEIAIITIYTIT